MSKNIHTPRDELVCGKLDTLEEALRLHNMPDAVWAISDIRHDCNRMEAALVSRKAELADLRAKLTASEASRKELREALEHIETLSAKLRYGGPDASDLNDLSDALQEATDIAHEALANDAEQR